MLGRREKRFLVLLAAAAAISFLAAGTGLALNRLRSAREIQPRYRSQIARFQQSIQSQPADELLRAALLARLEEERSHFYSAGEMDPYSFGTGVRKKLASLGMHVVRYQVLEIKGRDTLEFSVSGPARALVLFLKEVSESKKYWSISLLKVSIHAGTAAVDAVLRIGYEESHS